MDGVRDWLERLGLARYAEVFEREEIDLESARHLTDDTLKALGIPTGPRLKLLAAVKSLDGSAETAPLSAPTSDTNQPSPRGQTEAAERRQITVMFCDLVGSTELAEALDPEDLRALMQSYQQVCGAAIERYSGHVAQYLGDGVMSYFGWPRAHEDDAERAIRSALDILEAVAKVPATTPLRVRVGIATGTVVVGETGAGDAAIPKAAVGETPNIAARLMGVADPDQVIISDATKRLVGDTFDLRAVGARALKGVPQPVQLWQVRGLSQAEGRFEAAHAGYLTPMVGREEEIALLLRRWQQAKDGEGQVVLLSGEPGIGKSRILRELSRRSAAERHTRLRFQCSPYHAKSAFYPIIAHFERGAGFERDDSSNAKLRKLAAFVQRAGRVPDSAVPLFAAMLSLDPGELPAAQSFAAAPEGRNHQGARSAACRADRGGAVAGCA